MAARLVFRVEGLAVDGDVEDALRPGSEGEGLHDVLVVGENVGCRAHGAVEIVSGDAVGDVDDVHCRHIVDQAFYLSDG